MNGLRFAAVFALSAAMTMTGCKKTPPPPATQTLNSDGSVSNPNGTVTVPAGSPAAQQTAQQTGQPAPGGAAPQQYAVRNPDGSITNPDGSVTYPAGSRVASKENAPNGSPAYAPAPASVNQPEAPAAAVAAPVYRSVPAGTSMTVRVNRSISAHASGVGDRWSGSLVRPLVYRGETIFASGTSVEGEVVASKGVGRFKGAGDLGIEVTSVGGKRVETSEYEKVRKGRGKRSAAFTAGGGGLGALIGGLAGGGKGAIIGGLAGAGGGAAAGSYTGNTDVVIPAEAVISFRLRSELTR